MLAEAYTLPLPNGWRLECGGAPEDNLPAGAYVALFPPDGGGPGEEAEYWTFSEWQDDPVLIMGAIFACAHDFSTGNLKNPVVREWYEKTGTEVPR